MLVFGGQPETEDLHFGSFWHLKVEITWKWSSSKFRSSAKIPGLAPRCLGLKIQIANCNTLVCQISSLKFTTRHLIPLHHVSSSLISRYPISPHLISPRLTSSHLVSSNHLIITWSHLDPSTPKSPPEFKVPTHHPSVGSALSEPPHEVRVRGHVGLHLRLFLLKPHRGAVILPFPTWL